MAPRKSVDVIELDSSENDCEEGRKQPLRLPRRSQRTAARAVKEVKEQQAAERAQKRPAASQARSSKRLSVELRAPANGRVCKPKSPVAVTCGRAAAACMMPAEALPQLEKVDPTASEEAKVKLTIRIFNHHYLASVKVEDERRAAILDKVTKKGSALEKNPSRRPDLKALSKMKELGQMLHREKVVGHFPGVHVGDRFFSRCELAAIGMHQHWMAGIDTVNGKLTGFTDASGEHVTIASSIVMSGRYEDDVDNAAEVEYTGEGGNDLLGTQRQMGDQDLVRGNLALKNNMDTGAPVRLMRGLPFKESYTGKIFIYDGLYKVVDYYVKEGLSKFRVFTFRLRREPDQQQLTTDQVRFNRGTLVPKSIAGLPGLVCADISGGLEARAIHAVNLVDEEPEGPKGLRYMAKLQPRPNIPAPPPPAGCSCVGPCTDSSKCACAVRNGGRLPYVYTKHATRLSEARTVVLECGPACGCPPDCTNRVLQRGITRRLEVFRTTAKGWGVRSWDTITAGSFVCEYVGHMLTNSEAEELRGNDTYLFDIDTIQTARGMGRRQARIGQVAIQLHEGEGTGEAAADEPPSVAFALNASEEGNVARYINHSCSPNLFVQSVLWDHSDLTRAHIGLYAADNIPPLQELTYDYGYEVGSVSGRAETCYCQSPECRQRIL